MDATAQVSMKTHCSRYVEAYEIRGRLGPKALAAVLPPRSDPDYLWVLTELVRADLDHHWAAGTPIRLSAYADDFPELFTDPDVARALLGEEDRLRERYAAAPVLRPAPRPFGGRLAAYPTLNPDDTPPPVAYLEATREISVTPGPVSSQQHPLTDLVLNRPTDSPITRPRSTTPGADADSAPARFPVIGEVFLGFRLVQELGSGAFGRVFLAEQQALANRPVALKVTTRPTREAQRLAKLRHTNIVPIHSVHDEPPLQAVCMPFLGRRTLADLIREYRSTGTFPCTVVPAVTTVAAARTTVVSPRKGSRHTLAALAAPPTEAEARATSHAAETHLSHIDLVLGLVARLAGGLAHAHETGILHLDLKPANVLLADDGQPLLLDFNLAFDVRAGDREKAGGTLPYMSPEQLDEYEHNGPSRVDHRSDLYGLGVIFFELLTGRHPFPHAGGRPSPSEMARVRRAGAPRLRPLNPSVACSVEAIVRKLLDPEPERRYQSAEDLLTDLERHRQNLPLRFAPDRSIPERVGKWRRRHPRLWVYLLLAGALAAVSGTGAAAYRETTARHQSAAISKARGLRDELARLRVELTSPFDVKNVTLGLTRGREQLAIYGLPGAANWTHQPDVRRLPDAEQAALANDLGELALLMADAEWLAGRYDSPTGRAAAIERALKWNHAATLCFAGRTAPAAVEAQRRRLLGQAVGSAPSLTDSTDIDLYLRASELMADGRFRTAIPILEELTTRNPGHFGGQFALGACRQHLADYPTALERFQMAKAVAPDDPRPPFQRGLILLTQARADRSKYALAEAEFTAALKRDPKHAASYRLRALARMRLPDLPGAAADLDRASEYGSAPIRIHLYRADLHELLGEHDAAKRERKAAAVLTPVDSADYLVRGNSRVKAGDTAGALTDFAHAVRLNPHYVIAWQDQAHVLADILNQPAKAAEVQEKAVMCNQDNGLARSGLAVLLARLGRRDAAHAEIEKAQVLSSDPLVTYQAACVYALTSANHPEDRRLALDLFRRALRDGYREFHTITSDADLKAIRSTPEFARILRAAEDLLK
jgi:serine/threonine protein kinase/Flp pilus assembly protein TadD